MDEWLPVVDLKMDLEDEEGFEAAAEKGLAPFARSGRGTTDAKNGPAAIAPPPRRTAKLPTIVCCSGY